MSEAYKDRKHWSEMKRLVIYEGKSVYENGNTSDEFLEGPQSIAAQNRNKLIREKLEAGFLEKIILAEIEKAEDRVDLKTEHAELLRSLVGEVTSEKGRALVGLTILQLCIKIICPEQCIRLHKGGRSESSFSWQEGLSMRSLDNGYITPLLRKYDLLTLNKDGFMMTRSLAENYPYTDLYKAKIRGDRASWFKTVDAIEDGSLDLPACLRFLVGLLIDRGSKFSKLTQECMANVASFCETSNEVKTLNLLVKFVQSQEHGARVFEVVIHSFFQTICEWKLTEGSLRPLSQMRSANKKHGNIGDVEILHRPNSPIIIESWDAKFGKPDLSEEIEEIAEKLIDHPNCKLAGFICDVTPKISKEMKTRITEIEDKYELGLKVIAFEDFFVARLDKTIDRDKFSRDWLVAFAESLCQKRRTQAPIDEPCDAWVESLTKALKSAN